MNTQDWRLGLLEEGVKYLMHEASQLMIGLQVQRNAIDLNGALIIGLAEILLDLSKVALLPPDQRHAVTQLLRGTTMEQAFLTPEEIALAKAELKRLRTPTGATTDWKVV